MEREVEVMWRTDHIWIFSPSDVLLEVLGTAPGACPFLDDAVLTEDLNGVDKLEFSIPGDHPRASQVVRGNVAVIENVDGSYKAFKIQTQWQGMGEDGVRYRRFYCEDIAIDELNAAPVIERRPSDPRDAMEKALEYSIWDIGDVDDAFPPATTSFYHETALSCLRKMEEAWGGYVRFRITHDGVRITGRFVDFTHVRRGYDNSKRILVGKDMRSIEEENDVTGLATALYGYGRGEEIEETGGYGRRISFANVEWSVENGDPVDKPLGQEWVGDEDAREIWGLQGGAIHRFDFIILEDIEDPEELLLKTWEELQVRKAPRTSYKVLIADLENIEGREFEAVRIGDWVTVIDEDMRPRLEFRAKIIETKRYLNDPSRTELIIGHAQRTFEETLYRMEKDLTRIVRQGEPLQTAFQTTPDEIESHPGYGFITKEDGFASLDSTRDETTSAIRMKNGSLDVAGEYDEDKQDFEWKPVISGKGINGEGITEGTLNASLVPISCGGMQVTGDDSLSIRSQQTGKELVKLNDEGMWIRVENFNVPIIYIGDQGGKIDFINGAARWAQSAGNYIYQSPVDGNIQIRMDEVIRHRFKADGTKEGGSIEIDGRIWGMSPIDSPRILIEDVLFDQPVDENGVIVQIEERLSKALSTYAVFPSRGDVSVTEKTPTNFKITGPSGTVDLRIVGIRYGKEDVYFEDMKAIQEEEEKAVERMMQEQEKKNEGEAQ